MQTKSMKHSSASKAGGPRKRSNRCSKPADPHYHQQAPKRHKQCTPRWPTDAPVMTWHTTSCRVPGLSVTLRRHPPCGGIVRTSRHSSCSPQKDETMLEERSPCTDWPVKQHCCTSERLSLCISSAVSAGWVISTTS